MKRKEEEGENEARSKIRRTEGESRGGIVKDIDMGSTFRNSMGQMVDSIDEVEWVNELEEVTAHKRPVIRMHGGKNGRAVKMCEVQHLTGGFYLWDAPKCRNDALILELSLILI